MTPEDIYEELNLLSVVTLKGNVLTGLIVKENVSA